MKLGAKLALAPGRIVLVVKGILTYVALKSAKKPTQSVMQTCFARLRRSPDGFERSCLMKRVYFS